MPAASQILRQVFGLLTRILKFSLPKEKQLLFPQYNLGFYYTKEKVTVLYQAHQADKSIICPLRRKELSKSQYAYSLINA